MSLKRPTPSRSAIGDVNCKKYCFIPLSEARANLLIELIYPIFRTKLRELLALFSLDGVTSSPLQFACIITINTISDSSNQAPFERIWDPDANRCCGVQSVKNTRALPQYLDHFSAQSFVTRLQGSFPTWRAVISFLKQDSHQQSRSPFNHSAGLMSANAIQPQLFRWLQGGRQIPFTSHGLKHSRTLGIFCRVYISPRT